MQLYGRRLKRNEISVFSKLHKLHKENDRNNKNVSAFLIFYLLSSSFFFLGFTFYKEALCFITFILSLCSNTLTLESIFEYIRQKLIKNMLILKFHPGMKCLHVFFSFFHPGMKSHPCFSYWDEFIPG